MNIIIKIVRIEAKSKVNDEEVSQVSLGTRKVKKKMKDITPAINPMKTEIPPERGTKGSPSLC